MRHGGLEFRQGSDDALQLLSRHLLEGRSDLLIHMRLANHRVGSTASYLDLRVLHPRPAGRCPRVESSES